MWKTSQDVPTIEAKAGEQVGHGAIGAIKETVAINNSDRGVLVRHLIPADAEFRGHSLA